MSQADDVRLPDDQPPAELATRCFIHYDPDRIDYAIGETELDELKQATSNHWKDFCLFCVGVGLPCLLNAFSLVKTSTQNPFSPTLEFTLNLIVGIIGIVLGAAFGVAWYKTGKNADAIINRIKGKPKIQLPLPCE